MNYPTFVHDCSGTQSLVMLCLASAVEQIRINHLLTGIGKLTVTEGHYIVKLSIFKIRIYVSINLIVGYFLVANMIQTKISHSGHL